MEKRVLTILLLGFAVIASADNYKYLTIESSDGNQTSLNAVGLTISFSGGNLVASNGTESATISLSTLSAMRFSATKDSSGNEAGISTASITDDGFSIKEADAIYDINGRQVPLSDVKKGIYIIKKGQTTRKIQVK